MGLKERMQFKTFFLFTVIFFCSLTLFSQVKFSFNYGLGVGTKQINPAVDSYDSEALALRKRTELLQPDHEFGINVHHTLKRSRVDLIAGIAFRSSGFTTHKLVSPNQENFDDMASWRNQENAKRSIYKLEDYYVHVPILAHWVYHQGHCDAFVEVGLSNAIYLGSKLTISELHNEKNSASLNLSIPTSPFYSELSLATGVTTRIADLIPFFIKLKGNYQLNETTRGEWAERRFGFGVMAGVMISLQN